MTDIARLNFLVPPPGYNVDVTLGEGGAEPLDQQGRAAALASAWTHYKARCDPPGMQTREWTGPDKAWIWSVVTMPERRGLAGSLEAARAVAWARYARCVRLSEAIDRYDERVGLHTSDHPGFKQVLEWGDEDITSMERWIDPDGYLASIGAPAPEVLRG